MPKFSAIINKGTLIKDENNMKYIFYHLTDLHYYSKKNFDCDPWSLPQFSSEVAFRESEEILKEALNIILNDADTNTAIITGDLTNHGDEASHNELVEIFKDFESKGGRPFVVTDRHDYPHFEIFRIDKNGNKVPNEHLSREQAVPMYYPFGRDKAFDTFSDDTTYIAEILPKLWYIALGYDLTTNNTHDPAFSGELLEWVKKQTEKAKEENAIVICGTHWPIVSPSPAYNLLGKGNYFVDGEKASKLLADMGIHLAFTGHTHIQKVKTVVSDSGNTLYHIQTAALTGYPPKMRKIIIDTETGEAEIKTIDLDVPALNLKMTLTEFCRKGFLGSIEKIPYNMEHDIEAFLNTGGGITLPKDLIKKHPKIVRFLGKKLNNLTYGKMAKFSKKYHGMKKQEYAHLENEKVVPFIFELVAGLYKGNPPYSPDTVEYKIAMGVIKKATKISKTLHIDIKKILGGFTLEEFVEPLLYNSGLDDDNLKINIKK